MNDWLDDVNELYELEFEFLVKALNWGDVDLNDIEIGFDYD